MTRSSRGAKTLISAAIIGVSLVAAPLVALPAAANPGGTSIVISEAYLGGGNGGATYNSKFVELYNPTLSPVSLNGSSLQYRSASGTANPSTVMALTGTIPAKGHYLVQGSTGTNGVPLPTA